MSERIQLRRTAGWRKPEGAVVVSRPGPWGNPFTVHRAQSRRGGVYDMWGVSFEGRQLVRWDTRELAAKEAVERFELWLRDQGELLVSAWRALHGRDLACWCPPGQACHADVWLRVVDRPIVLYMAGTAKDYEMRAAAEKALAEGRETMLHWHRADAGSPTHVSCELYALDWHDDDEFAPFRQVVVISPPAVD